MAAATQPFPPSLETRLADLERRFASRERRWKLIAMCCVAAMFITVVVAVDSRATAQPSRPAHASVVRAERFELVESDGTVRGRFGLHGSSWPCLTMNDSAGHERIFVGMTRVNSADDGPEMSLINEKGNSAVFESPGPVDISRRKSTCRPRSTRTKRAWN